MADTVAKQSISAECAQKLIAAAAAKARELGKAMVIAVCDESGMHKALLRMDGAALISIDVAINKAKTAVGFGIPTHVWHDFIKNDPPLAMGATAAIPGLVIFGGGYPVKIGDQLVGGIGVSGGHYTDDMKVAEAALAVIAK